MQQCKSKLQQHLETASQANVPVTSHLNTAVETKVRLLNIHLPNLHKTLLQLWYLNPQHPILKLRCNPLYVHHSRTRPRAQPHLPLKRPHFPLSHLQRLQKFLVARAVYDASN